MRKIAIVFSLSCLALSCPATDLSATSGAIVATDLQQATSLLRVPNHQLRRLINTSQVIEYYESFALLKGTGAQLQAIEAQLLGAQILEAGYQLALPGDRSAADPQLRQPWDRNQRAEFAAGEVYLLQFHGPSKAQWLSRLSERGVDAFQYIHPYTYLVWNRSGQLADAARGLNSVRWVGEYPSSAKLAFDPPARVEASTAWRVVAYRGAKLAAAALENVGARVQEVAATDAVMENWIVNAPLAALTAIAALPGVLSVQDLPTNGGNRGEIAAQQFAANVVNNQPQLGYIDWLAGFGLNGSNVVLANVDGGLDQNHPDLAGRVLPCVSSTCVASTSSSHGTHTAGAMVANGASGTRDVRGFLRGLGAAPGAKIIEQAYPGFFNQAGGMLLLMRESASNSAYLSSNSWGPSSTPRGYDAQTRQVDVGTRDTDPNLPGDQPLLFVVSIMNGNGGVSSQGTPDEAKNVLVVGSTHSQNSAGVPLATWQSVSGNSGHGPALDGRIIPHVLAPGCSTDSLAQGAGYGFLCGTSMASPMVSGGLGVFVEGYKNRNQNRLPSPELAKAYAVASSTDLFGGLDADNIALTRRPNATQGFGALRLNAMLAQIDNTVFIDRPVVFTEAGQSRTVRLSIKDPTKPVKLMLAYTDAPGAGTCASSTCTTPAWVNDLNLQVRLNNQLWLGNVFGSDGYSQIGGSADQRNNLELVALPASTAGTLEVDVFAANIAGDALPNSIGSLQQDYALVCVNCKIAQNFSVSASPSIETRVCARNGGSELPNVAFTVTAEAGFSDALTASLQTPWPQGFALSVSPTNVTAPANLSVSGTVDSSAQSGLQAVTLRIASGTGDDVLRIFNYRVALNNPAAPSALALVSGVSITRPIFSWAVQPDATGFELQISRTADFLSPATIELPGSLAQWQPEIALRAETAYFWRIRALGPCGASNYSSGQPFNTGTSGILVDGFEDY